MPQPSTNQVHVNRPLTDISVAYLQDPANFAYSRCAPMLPVEKDTDIYALYTKDYWLRDDVQITEPGGEDPVSGYGIDFTNTYRCDIYRLAKDITVEERANSDSPLQPDTDATLYLSGQFARKQEIVLASVIMQTGVWNGASYDITGVAANPGNNQVYQWSDYTNSTPVEDIRNQKAVILQNTGFEPNKLILGYQTFNKLIDHPELIDRVKYTGGIVDQVKTLKNLADLFQLEDVIVSKGVKNAAAEGVAFNGQFIFGKTALLCYVPKTPGKRIPSAFYGFYWKGVSGGMGTTVAMRRFVIPHRDNVTRIAGKMAFTWKIIGSDLGMFFDSIVA